MRIYAIGDIHGQLQMLQQAHALIAADRQDYSDQTAPVVHLGDYTDRGPDSAGVVQALIDGIDAGLPWLAIKGNHDRLFTGFLGDAQWQDPYLAGRLAWFDPRLGGDKTLASYGVQGAGNRPIADVHREAISTVPSAHREFLERLPLYHQTPELLFVHAGIRPGIPIEQQDEEDLIWIRDGFLEDDTDHGTLVVHGHTALDQATHFGNRVDLDSGAGYFRPLTVAVFEERSSWILTDAGRVPLSSPD
jgi:serine/threonine protein phosphatase 1